MSTLAFSWETPLDDPAYPRLKEYLVQFTGLAYYTERDVELTRLLGRRLAATGLPDCAAYLGLLRDSFRGTAELDALIAEITIGETYFFRHQEHFDALRDHVLPERIARNQATRTLRIWCAGCADGSEPYSLSILLKRELADPLAGWDVSILATDINRHSLARAREAQFPAWSLRAIDETLKQQCFTRQGNLWSLDAQYRTGVTFRYHNLADGLPPSQVPFDLIFCRNVMIYFSPELMQRMVKQFHEGLAAGAWLLVGPAEPNMTFFTAFTAVQLSGLTVYQKPLEMLQSQPRMATSCVLAEPVARFADRAGKRAELAPKVVEQAVTGGQAPPSLARREVNTPVANRPEASDIEAALAEARGYADGGQWEIAAGCCEALLTTYALEPRVHLMHGLILEQMGKSDLAEQSLRRAIYLDRRSVLGHYYLALLLKAQGQTQQAARGFENTVRLLEPVSGEQPFSDAEGITAEKLRESAVMHLALLRQQTSPKPCDTPA